MAFLNHQNSGQTTAEPRMYPPNSRDADPSTMSHGFIANIVDIFDDPNHQQHQSELEIRDPVAFHGDLHPTPLPPVPFHHHGRSHAPFNNRHAFPNMPRYPPYQVPFRVPVRPMAPPNSSSRHPAFDHVHPSFPPPQSQPQSMGNSHYSLRNSVTFESPSFAQLESDETEIGGIPSFTSAEGDISQQKQTTEGPKKSSSLDMEGKKLVLAVSESVDMDEEVPSIPDSPGPAFFSFDDINDADEFDGCFKRHPATVDSFTLLPSLDDENGKQRMSPPMMPSLGQSLSWEAPQNEQEGDCTESSKRQPPALPGKSSTVDCQ